MRRRIDTVRCLKGREAACRGEGAGKYRGRPWEGRQRAPSVVGPASCAGADVVCTVYCVWCTDCGVQCRVKCAVCSVWCAVCSVECSVQSLVCSVQCAEFSLQCASTGVLLHTAKKTLSDKPRLLLLLLGRRRDFLFYLLSTRGLLSCLLKMHIGTRGLYRRGHCCDVYWVIRLCFLFSLEQAGVCS